MNETGEQARYFEGVKGRIGGTSYIVLTCLTNYTLAEG